MDGKPSKLPSEAPEEWASPQGGAQSAETDLKAPKRFRSAYILFARSRQQEVRNELALQGRAMKVSIGCCAD